MVRPTYQQPDCRGQTMPIQWVLTIDRQLWAGSQCLSSSLSFFLLFFCVWRACITDV